VRAAFPTAVALAVLGLFARGAAGCAADDDDANAVGDDGGAGSSFDGATAIDGTASGDANADADAGVDAALPCSPDGWCHTTFPSADIADAAQVDPAFVPIDLHDVWVMPDHDAWAVAEQGYVLHWTKNAWSMVFAANVPLRTVWAASASDVWIAGTGGVVFHGTPKAGQLGFDKVDLGTTDDVLRVRGKSATDVLAITANGIFHSAGVSFEAVPFPNGIPHDATQTLGDMWIRGGELWIGAHEFSTCDQFDDACGFQDHTLLLRWKGMIAASDGGPSASFDRAPLEMVCDRATCVVVSGTLAPDGSHLLIVKRQFQLPRGKPAQVAHVAAADAGLLDASAAQGDGGYVWTMDDPGTAGAGPTGVWAATGSRAWLVASPGVVRQWDGQAWTIARVAVGAPVTKDLRAIEGVVGPDGKSDVWIVGDNIALHRSESP